MNEGMKKAIIAIVLLALAVISCLYIADWASDPKTHSATIRKLDEKKATATALAASATSVSVLLSVIPDDIATPVADKFADVALYFGLVLCALFTEKYLVTILGLAVFRIILPLALLLLGISLFWQRRGIRVIAAKLIAVGMALYLAIPVSMNVADLIDRTFETTYQATVSEAESFSSEDNSGIFETIKGAAKTYLGKAANLLNRFVEGFVVMMVTTCIIPILVLLFFLWILKQLTGVDLTGRVMYAPIAVKNKIRELNKERNEESDD